MRVFHLTDLPSDLIFVYFIENFRKEFLMRLKTVFGTYRKMAEFVGYTDTGIIESFWS